MAVIQGELRMLSISSNLPLWTLYIPSLIVQFRNLTTYPSLISKTKRQKENESVRTPRWIIINLCWCWAYSILWCPCYIRSVVIWTPILFSYIKIIILSLFSDYVIISATLFNFILFQNPFQPRNFTSNNINRLAPIITTIILTATWSETFHGHLQSFDFLSLCSYLHNTWSFTFIAKLRLAPNYH